MKIENIHYRNISQKKTRKKLGTRENIAEKLEFRKRKSRKHKVARVAMCFVLLGKV